MNYYDDRTERLAEALLNVSPQRKLSIAYSGGVDSRFLAYFSDLSGFDVELLHVSGPHISEEESAKAKEWAESHGFKLRILHLNPLLIPEVSVNSRKRCYYCKRELFSNLLKEASFPLCDGTNHSDLGHYRPGVQALRELGIFSPLADAGISKKDIRELAAKLGMENPEQPSKPCVLTRFPYDVKLLSEELSLVMEAESRIEKYLEECNLHSVKFRIRKTGPEHFELHIQRSDLSGVNNDQILALQAVAKAVSSKFADIPLVGLDSLSGYFDKKK